MSQIPSPAPLDVSPEALRPVQEYYRQGLCLQAHRAAQAIGPLPAWRGTAARLIAGRLAYNLGAPRLSYGLHLTAWRADRNDPEACYFYARLRFERRGPLSAWKFLRKIGDLSESPGEIRADWFAFHACVLGYLRDFEAAEDWLARAEKTSPERPWICIERAHLFEMEDRYDDALAAARRSLQLRPWYRPGVNTVAHVLQLVDRDSEAIDLLTEADQRIESGLAVRQLAELQRELHRYAEARRSYERYRELSPLLEKELEKSLSLRQASIAYLCGDDSQASQLVRQVDDPICRSFAERLEQTRPEERRRELDVGFVRQHHYTCAPATLATISRFWNCPTNHLDIASDICYNGTPDSRERRWAEENGFVAREFTVTWDTACALIDRGIPFILTTVDIPYGHAQAVIGYDRCWQTLLIRDPYLRSMLEFDAEATFQRYRSSGPRGLVVVPAERAEMLDGIELPDARLYDLLYQLQRALADFDRGRAATFYAHMQTAAPTHRLTLWAGWLLPLYDADEVGKLAALDRLIESFPHEAGLLVFKLWCLQTLARREERLAILATACTRKEPYPLLWQMDLVAVRANKRWRDRIEPHPYLLWCYAEELAVDPRDRAEAMWLIRRVLRTRPMDHNAFSTLAGLLRSQRGLADALELDRFAACVDDKNEGMAQKYFFNARLSRQTEKAMHWLQKRCERYADRSSLPVRVLFWAYQLCERATEGFAVLDAQLMLRPDDGELKLFAAQAQADHGNYDRANYLLKGAEGHCPRMAWLRTAAHVAHGKGDLPGSLALWRQVLAGEPTAYDAHRAVTQLLAETENRAAALAYLRSVCGRFPFNYPLGRLRVEWLGMDGPQVVEPEVRELIALHPTDGWACRELALALSALGRHGEAQAEAELCQQLEPHNTTTYSVLGQVHEQAGRRDQAREAFREAIRLSVDNTFAIHQLMAGCETFEQRRESLMFIESELIRQVIFGDGLWAWQFHAQQTMQPVELLQSLQKALDARPDHWQAWSAVVRQLLEMRRGDEALTLARQATSRFPLLPALWLDLAAASRACGDREGQRHAVGQALLINPGWGPALRQQAELHSDTGDFAQARAVLEDAIRRAPLDPHNYGPLAQVHWQMGEREAALERVQKAIEMDPGYEWAWRALRDWSRLLRKPEIAATAARRLTAARPNEARSWLVLAETLEGPAHATERLDALDRVLGINPRSVSAADLKAEHLAQRGQFEEARAVCTSAVFGSPLPLLLRGRAAWIESQRGEFYRAIEQMHALLIEDPKYYWGWQNLTEWYKHVNAKPGQLESANQLVNASPDSPLALCHRGKARLASGDRRGAKADFRRAIEISPSSRDATGALFEVQLDDKEYEAAARTLTLMRGHHFDDVTLAREIQLLSRTREQSKAVDFFRQMTVGSRAPGEALSIGARALVSAGCATQLDQVLEQALQSPDTNPAVGEVWVDRWVARGQWGLVDRLRQRLDAMLSKGEVGQRAIDALGRKAKELEQPNLRKLLERVLERYQPKV
jgi:cellulose synthase operon protein C